MESSRRDTGKAGVAALVALAVVLACALAPAGAGAAQKPNRWVLSGASSIPNKYWQGLTSDPARQGLFFIGVFQGLWRSDPDLLETAGVGTEIPASVTATAGYNHIGDPTWFDGDGGRVLLPMECYDPSQGNTCGTGAFGIADPETLAFDYYVQLDPAELPKAMWAETSPGGKFVWTSSGDDLLAYRSSDITQANAAPTGPVIKAAKRLPGAVPPSGITGAVFRGKHRLLLAGSDGGSDQVWSVDTKTGKGRLVLQRKICGESEGLDIVPTLGGKLHWLIAPNDPGCDLSFGPSSALLHFVRARGHRRFKVHAALSGGGDGGPVPGTFAVEIRVKRPNGKPLRHGKVSFASATAHTDGRGRTMLTTQLELPGRFKAVVRKHGRWGASHLIQVGEPTKAAGRRIPVGGAG